MWYSKIASLDVGAWAQAALEKLVHRRVLNRQGQGYDAAHQAMQVILRQAPESEPAISGFEEADLAQKRSPYPRPSSCARCTGA